MAVTLFELLAKLTLDTKEFDTNASNVTTKAGGITKSLEGMTARAVAMGNAMYNMSVNAAKAAWNFGIDLIETAAEVQAEQAQFASVFEGVESQAWDVFNRIGSMANIHTGRLMSLGTGVYTQFRSAGMDSAEAMTAMEETLSLAADAAAFYDISLEDATHMVKSFLRGNVEAGESIGLFANDALRSTYAMEMYGLKWAGLNELQKEAVLLAIAQDTYENAQATGQAAREADNYTNVLNNLKETWRQIKAIIGEPILNAIVPVLKEFEKFLKDNPEVVEAFADAIGIAANWLKDMIVGALQYITEHKDEILGFIEGVGRFLGIIPKTPEQIAAEEYAAEVSAVSAPIETGAPTSSSDIAAAIEVFNAASNALNRGETGGDTDAFTDAWIALDQLLNTDEQKDALFDWMMDRGIDVYNPDEDTAEGDYSIPSELVTMLTSLPGEMASAVVSGLAGFGIEMDKELVGHLVAPTVMGVMARNSRESRYTAGTAKV